MLQTIELVPGGSRVFVTEENKFRYLDALAQHRFVNSVKDQVDAFIHGLNEIVPDNILSIFDENELEVRPNPFDFYIAPINSWFNEKNSSAFLVSFGSTSCLWKVIGMPFL